MYERQVSSNCEWYTKLRAKTENGPFEVSQLKGASRKMNLKCQISQSHLVGCYAGGKIFGLTRFRRLLDAWGNALKRTRDRLRVDAEDALRPLSICVQDDSQVRTLLLPALVQARESTVRQPLWTLVFNS